ncbi:Nijmegen breakage syndrome 1 protein [Sesamum alatum]|uniref:Nijmegen breakage syndrome 1 protein n=1 Tax=Sesamum alatum TaxID=300844 RepID=A0AAE1YHR8_9LAMI|nr:Nijmegen breakage syndrome 1 protein [Sesamum alatum]
MVWGLFPVDPLPGEHEYYFFRKGTYKVGRKGCDIIVNKDKGVSRVHAEIIVDEMICMDHLQKRHSNNSSKVRIRDCSKYGTFINKNLGSKEKVHELPNRETMLKDGDIVAFGTGNAKYRFSFVSLVFFAPSFAMNQLQDKMSLIGATVTRTWTSKSTHMVLDDFVQIDDDIVDAIVARKPLVRFSWIELIAGTTICSEIPSSLSHAPTLTLEGASLKVTDPQSREQCLRGYTFLLESIQKYKFKEKLQLLLDLASAKVVYVESQDPCSQNLGDNLVYVMPAGSTSSNGGVSKFNSLHTVKEMELISAVVSGHLDPSVMASAPVLVASSCSTDETVVADSDVEMETATSIPASGPVIKVETSEDECLRKITVNKAESSKYDCIAENIVHIEESIEHDDEENASAFKTIAHESEEFLPPNRDTLKPDSPYQTARKFDGTNITSSRDKNEGNVTRKDKGLASETENLDIIYSQDLIVRETNLPQSGHSSLNGAAINFKRFRKTSAPSGNSFNNLIPYSKYPYEESDYGNEDVAEYVKEEKKRKQMEAIADDLFNNEKGRKRGAAGSLSQLFARG